MSPAVDSEAPCHRDQRRPEGDTEIDHIDAGSRLLKLRSDQVGFSRQSSGKCWISTRTSASVLSVATVGMMIVMGNGVQASLHRRGVPPPENESGHLARLTCQRNRAATPAPQLGPPQLRQLGDVGRRG